MEISILTAAAALFLLAAASYVLRELKDGSYGKLYTLSPSDLCECRSLNVLSGVDMW